MAQAFEHITSVKLRVFNFIGQRIYELENEIRIASAELKMWKEFTPTLNVCKHCGGDGKIRHRIDVDEWGPIEQCSACNGTGKEVNI